MEFILSSGPVFTALTIKMQAGEKIKAEAGAMVSMSPTLELQAKASGIGCGVTVPASRGANSLFGSIFTAQEAGGLGLALGVQGDILHHRLQDASGRARRQHQFSGLLGSEKRPEKRLAA